MPEVADMNAALLSNPVPSSLIDHDEPAPAKAEVKANPAPAAEDNKTDTPDATDENADPSGETPEQKAQKQSRRQRKLERERDARIRAETRAEMLERELQAVKAPKQVAAESGEPKIDGINPKTGVAWTLDEYVAAASKYEADKRFDERQAADQKASQQRDAQTRASAAEQKVAEEWVKQEKELEARIPSYQEDVESFTEEYIPKLSMPVRQALAEFGPAVLHHLATHEDEVEAMLKLSPARQVAALGRIDATVKADAAPEQEPPSRRTPEPPAPARHVRQGSTQPAGLSDDMDAYIEQRRKQGARWAR